MQNIHSSTEPPPWPTAAGVPFSLSSAPLEDRLDRRNKAFRKARHILTRTETRLWKHQVPDPRSTAGLKRLPVHLRQAVWDHVCGQARILPLFPFSIHPDHPVCPEPNPAVLSVDRESRAMALRHYQILHNGDQIPAVRAMLNDEGVTLPLPGGFVDEIQGEPVEFGRPRRGPWIVYYNPSVDIILLTNGLGGLSIPMLERIPLEPTPYSVRFGFDLSMAERLGMLWCRTGEAFDPARSVRQNMDSSIVQVYAEVQRRTRNILVSVWLERLMNFVDTAVVPSLRRVVLMDSLNLDRLDMWKLGLGIDLLDVPRGSVSSSWWEVPNILPLGGPPLLLTDQPFVPGVEDDDPPLDTLSEDSGGAPSHSQTRHFEFEIEFCLTRGGLG